MKIIVLGVTGAGKTTTLEFLRDGSTPTFQRRPTLAFTPYTFEYGKIKLVFVDVPGQQTYWYQWKRYLDSADGIMFVIDSTKPHLLPTINHLLVRTLELDRSRKPIAFAVNKRDIKQSLSSESIEAILNFRRIRQGDRLVRAFDASAVTGQGLVEAVTWLVWKIHEIEYT